MSIEKVVGRNGHYHTKMRQNKKNLAVDEKSERGEKWSIISIIFQPSSDIKQQNAYRDERAWIKERKGRRSIKMIPCSSFTFMRIFNIKVVCVYTFSTLRKTLVRLYHSIKWSLSSFPSTSTNKQYSGTLCAAMFIHILYMLQCQGPRACQNNLVVSSPSSYHDPFPFHPNNITTTIKTGWAILCKVTRTVA